MQPLTDTRNKDIAWNTPEDSTMAASMSKVHFGEAQLAQLVQE